jgi:hypothetical protein
VVSFTLSFDAQLESLVTQDKCDGEWGDAVEIASPHGAVERHGRVLGRPWNVVAWIEVR